MGWLLVFSIFRRGICPTKSNINWQPPPWEALSGGGLNFFHFFALFLSDWHQNFFLYTIGHFNEKKIFFLIENQKWQKKSVLKIENHPKIWNFLDVFFLTHENNEKRCPQYFWSYNGKLLFVFDATTLHFSGFFWTF